MDEADRLEHVGDVIQATYLGLEQLLVEDLAIGDLLGSLFER